MENQPIKVIYIGGYGRSGSTVLGRVLGGISGFFNVGEMRYIWERSFRNNQLCGCGNAFNECEFWKKVIDYAFDDLEHADLKKIINLKHNTELKSNILYAAFPKLRSKKYSENLKAYSHILLNLYRSIQKISGCEVIVDSSKNPAYGFILSCIPEIELQTIHTVRDSRATAYSWLKKKERPEITSKTEYMPIISSFQSSIEWQVLNILTGFMKFRSMGYIRIRYENFAEDVKGVIREILSQLEYLNKDLEFVTENSVELGEDHTVAGNPIRLKKGKITIKLDTDWKKSLSFFKKCLVTFLTWPLLKLYNYSFYKN